MNIVPDYRLDMTGEPCPYPAVATLEALPQLKKAKFWKSSATARSQSITFLSMRETMAIRCWTSSRMGQRFVI
jgi:hypothetical protein